MPGRMTYSTALVHEPSVRGLFRGRGAFYLGDEVEWAGFYFVVDAADIFAEDADADELDAAEEGGMALKERAMRLCRLAGGHRLLFDAIVPGGVGAQTLRERPRIARELDDLARDLEAYLTRLFAQSSTVARWQRAGVVSRESARAFGAVGPAHRASRGEIDVRTFAPYGAYREFAVRIAHASGGDSFGRLRVKRDEIRESLRLIGAAARL